ncbi:MAG TPA: hypothetical protein VJ965_10255 [Anaerolineales bacterium]|nr:hypothetical protein [Anaerolineales bacterium]
MFNLKIVFGGTHQNTLKDQSGKNPASSEITRNHDYSPNSCSTPEEHKGAKKKTDTL